jgi:hypothetical protein
MYKSTEGMAGEWRKQALSGQALCRSSTGAAFRGGASLYMSKGIKVNSQILTPIR